MERGYWVEVVKVAPERGLESVCPRLTGAKFLSTSKAVRFHNSRYSPLKPAEDLHFDSSNEKEISLVDVNRAGTHVFCMKFDAYRGPQALEKRGKIRYLNHRALHRTQHLRVTGRKI